MASTNKSAKIAFEHMCFLQVCHRIFKKRLHVRVEHVTPSRCREDFLRRVNTNDKLKHDAKVAGGILHLLTLLKSALLHSLALLNAPHARFTIALYHTIGLLTGSRKGGYLLHWRVKTGIEHYNRRLETRGAVRWGGGVPVLIERFRGGQKFKQGNS